MKRRNFLKSSGVFTGGMLTSQFPFIAGPFTLNDFFGGIAPADKRLNETWVKSLRKRGSVTTYLKSKNELKYIGMPVGGICCGTVYLGGDGRLWLWDIFNKNQLGAITKVLPIKLSSFNLKEINNVEGSLYLEPLTEDINPLQQGIALVISQGDSKIVKRLHVDDWDEIMFEATYPVAKIRYIDKNLPVEVTLRAFSPFIPGDAKNSGLPATIQSVSIKNKDENSIQVSIIAWLENKMLVNTGKKNNSEFTRINRRFRDDYCSGISIECITENEELKKAPDYGNMSLSIIGDSADCISDLNTEEGQSLQSIKEFLKISDTSPISAIRANHTLKQDQISTTDFIICWHTPNSHLDVQGTDLHFYTDDFSNATAIAKYVLKNYESLKQRTFLWNQTWYDSTLPWWFLERTFLNISTLATSTSHRFQTGRFYAWEGVGCCPGTCTHVYQYAQAMAHVFPELERETREKVDLGVAFDPVTGMIGYRGENTGASIDGQAGTILRIYREYLMSSDGSILKNYWDRIKASIEFVMRQDKNMDGMEDTPMVNTLDALWSGEIAWIVGLCIASVRAGQKMAEEVNDLDFGERCGSYVKKGNKNMEEYLFNGEYFVQRPNPMKGKNGVGAYNTCEIDQVYGQAWAWQVGLGRILSKEKTMSALRALWKYNYMPDVGPYIEKHPGGRFYALAGEGGMVMDTNPRHDINPYGDAKAWQTGYFSECMSGFEHAVAAHMMAEGMIDESLVLTRTIHDRYYAGKRNPFNEIECSDHYGRAMASYGTFISACGFTYNGPKGYIGFAPKITPEDFKAPFTAAKGWGTYSQQKESNKFSAQLKMLYGEMKLKKLSFELDKNKKAKSVEAKLNNQTVACIFEQEEIDFKIMLVEAQVISQDESLSIGIYLE